MSTVSDDARAVVEKPVVALLRKNRERHGFSSSAGRHYLYWIWHSIKKRCRNPASSVYCYYGGRGIKLFPAWVESPSCFIRYVLGCLGERPTPNHTIDRVQTEGNYEPGNLRWATKTGQQRNRRDNRFFEINGEPKLLIEISEETGISINTLRGRIAAGYTPENVVQTGKFSRWDRRTDQ